MSDQEIINYIDMILKLVFRGYKQGKLNMRGLHTLAFVILYYYKDISEKSLIDVADEWVDACQQFEKYYSESVDLFNEEDD